MSAAPGPSEARLILDLVALPMLRMEHAITRRVIAAVPPDALEVRPVPGARRTGELLRHMVHAEVRYLHGAAGSEFPDWIEELARIQSPVEIGAWYGDRFGGVLKAVEAMDGASLLRLVDYRGLVRMPALGFVQFAVHHTIHHRGQLSLCLRAAGAEVPAIYG